MNAGSLCANITVGMKDGARVFFFEKRALTLLPAGFLCLGTENGEPIKAESRHLGFSIMIWDDDVLALRTYCERPAHTQ